MNNIDLIELKNETSFICLTDIKDTIDLNEILHFNKYSNFRKLIRITSWILRFVNNIKNKIKKLELFY